MPRRVAPPITGLHALMLRTAARARPARKEMRLTWRARAGAVRFMKEGEFVPEASDTRSYAPLQPSSPPALSGWNT